MKKHEPQLGWSGSSEAQRQADEAWAKVAHKPKATQRKPHKRRRKHRVAKQFVGTYREYLDSPQWRKKRRAALKIHGERCGVCGSAERLEAHHLHYRTLFMESPRDDLAILCRDCHAIEHEAKGAVDSVTARYLDQMRGA